MSVVNYVLPEGLPLEAFPMYSFALNGVSTNGSEQKRDGGLGLRYYVPDAGERFSSNLRYTRRFTTVPSQAQYNSVIQVSIIYNFYQKK